MATSACATSVERREVLVHNPLAITRPGELVALPQAWLRAACADLDLDQLAVRRGQEPLPVQRADLDLDGNLDAIVTLLRLGPGESSLLFLESPASVAAPTPACEVRVEQQPPLFRRLDRSAQEDARLPLPVVAALVRSDGELATPLFPPGATWRVLAPGPLWCSVEIEGLDGARLRIAASAGSSRLFVRFLPGPRGGRAVLVPGPLDGAATVEVRPPPRTGGMSAFGVFAAGGGRAALYRPEDAEPDLQHGRLRFRTAPGAGWRCEVDLPWDGSTRAPPASATAYGRQLEAITELSASPPTLRWR